MDGRRVSNCGAVSALFLLPTDLALEEQIEVYYVHTYAHTGDRSANAPILLSYLELIQIMPYIFFNLINVL